MKATQFIKISFTSRHIRAAIFLATLMLMGCGGAPGDTLAPASAEANASPLEEAVLKVEEDRGEPMGRKAEVEVPDELKHYSDRRRFLAIQIAEWREHDYPIPRDYTELIAMIKLGQLVEMEPLGEDYVLYCVGESATDGPFTHYDRARREEIALYAAYEEFEREYDRLTETLSGLQSRIADLVKEYKKTPRLDRDRRRALQDQIAEARQSAVEIDKAQKSLTRFYKNQDRRESLFSEYKTLVEIAVDFKGESYNLNAPPDRKRLKARLLSFIRPSARDLILEISRAYHEKFGRRLPVTSLVRTESYQRQLSETNKNATLIAAPPHTTGLAFDIYDGYMTAAEQTELMKVIASLETAGRVEALRENRNHIHVFAFADGRPPDERLITNSLKQVRGRR